MESTEIGVLPELSMFFSTMHSQAGDGRSALLPCLHAAQDLYGFITDEVISEIAANLSVKIEDINEIINFYPLFHREPARKTILHVCNDPICKLAGVETVFRTISHPTGEAKTVGGDTLEKAPCIGLCPHTPSVYIEANLLRIPVNNESRRQSGKTLIHARTEILGEPRIITARCGMGKSFGLMDYWSHEGYLALKRALSMTGNEIIEEVKITGLTGRGGEALLTGVKCEKVANSSQKKRYIVCNGAEADPMVFKDRVLLEDDPHSILEGMIIAAYAIKASQAYIFINGEYKLAFDSVSKAILDAREAGLLGRNIMGTGFNFDIEIRQGAGRYISGEETALLEAIEGKCAYPRKKPPFPTSRGLFEMPTVINNVETFCNIPPIIRMGPSEYRKIGTETSKGTLLVCLLGDVARPGLVEIPFGTSFRQLIFELGGGMKEGHTCQAVMVGGVTGKFITDEDMDIQISLESLKKNGLSLGPASVIVLDDSRNLRVILSHIGNFLAGESCGLCQSCVDGTNAQKILLEKFRKTSLTSEDVRQYRETLFAMQKSAQCNLGKTASNLARSAYKKWPSKFINLDE